MEKNTAFGVGGKKENHTGRYLGSLLQLLNQSGPTVVMVNLVHRPVDRHAGPDSGDQESPPEPRP